MPWLTLASQRIQQAIVQVFAGSNAASRFDASANHALYLLNGPFTGKWLCFGRSAYWCQRTRLTGARSAEKIAQAELKVKVNKLRRIYRQTTALKRKVAINPECKLRPLQSEQLRRLTSGELEAELDQLTREHGYGLIRSTDELLAAPRCTDYLQLQRC